jgi:hypothetical protein
LDLVDLSGKFGKIILPAESALKTLAPVQSPVRGLNHRALYLLLGKAPDKLALGQSFSKYNTKKSFSAVRAQ